MLIKIGNFEYTEVWDGVLYKKLSNYPDITPYELKTIAAFMEYEAFWGRECKLECEDVLLQTHICKELSEKQKYGNIQTPALLRECTACPVIGGCETKFVCHTTDVDSAASILKCGRLLSAVKARNLPAEVLAKEPRNAAKDPPDYFEYIMFAWGNCQAGDRLVTERRLGRFPNDRDLSVDFTPGIRFYFDYRKLQKHPQAIYDGVLPLKIRDEVILHDWLLAMVVPTVHKAAVEPDIPGWLLDRTLFLDYEQADIWEWSLKVYLQIQQKFGTIM